MLESSIRCNHYPAGCFSKLILNLDHQLFLHYKDLHFDLSFKGNSNSLATIDIASGFAGVETYQPVRIAIQIVLNTYSGPLLIVFGWWQYSVDKCVTSVSLSQKRNALLFWISFVLQLNMSLCLLSPCKHHYHLFI